MDIKETCRSLAGGCIVYVVVASCSPESGTAEPPPSVLDGAVASATGGRASNGGGRSAGGLSNVGGQANSDASSGAGTGTLLDAAIERITNPVRDARADTNTSGTRLRAKYFVGSDGSRQFHGWQDSQRNEDCSFGLASDGVLRCLPTGAQALSYFADSGCTQPLALVFKTQCPTKPTYAINYTTGCNAATRVFSVGAQVTAGDVFVGTPANCTAQPLSAVSNTFDLYLTTGEIPASTFVEATESVE